MVRARAARPTQQGPIIGTSPLLLEALRVVDRVASSLCAVLVSGESGTGKELVVAALHAASPRRDAPLVAVNCGAIPAELLESELFGATRGAFTGAQVTRRGYVAAAEGGTLFLDEVGELPLAMQVKLLRLVQQREYTPLGETRRVRCDIRVVAATNRNLEREVAEGRFREDLFFRLSVINVRLPPLRKRREDLPLLARHFFHEACERAGRTDLVALSADAMRTIELHPWPGNIRALANAIERGVLVADGPEVSAKDMFPARTSSFLPAVRAPSARFYEPAKPRAVGTDTSEPSPAPHRRTISSNIPRVLPDQGFDLMAASERYQNELISQAIVRTAGNKNRAAQLLGLNRTTLVEMMRRRRLPQTNS